MISLKSYHICGQNFSMWMENGAVSSVCQLVKWNWIPFDQKSILVLKLLHEMNVILILWNSTKDFIGFD